jgi:hypothetical protein
MKKPRGCCVCGCTDDRSCVGPGGPCVWVARRPALCSSCLIFLMNVKDGARLVAIAKLCGIPGMAEFAKRVGRLDKNTPPVRRPAARPSEVGQGRLPGGQK